MIEPQLLNQVRALPPEEMRAMIAHCAGLLVHQQGADAALKVLNSVAHAVRHGKAL